VRRNATDGCGSFPIGAEGWIQLAFRPGARRRKAYLEGVPPAPGFPHQLDEIPPKNLFQSSSTMTLRKISTALLLSLAGVLLVPTASASPAPTSARVDHPRPAHRHGHRPAPKPKPKPAPQNAN